ncbi:MAG: beta-ketoacyl-[acyl-carrier-protein] synthase family protein [Candidatus Omnitrophota bacterium]
MCNTVVVSGVGVVSSIGIGKDAFWKNLIAGKSGIQRITSFNTENYARHYAGEVRDFNPYERIPSQAVPFLGRASQFAISAAKLALEDACIQPEELRNRKTAIVLGTTLPEGNAVDFVSQMLMPPKEWDGISAQDLFNVFPPSMPKNIGDFLGIEARALLIPCACAAGNYAIAYGCNLIKNHAVDIAIVGGSEALSRLTFQGFHRLQAMAQERCAPFDKDREGMVMGEGAGILILECLEKAVERKAAAYARILGYGLSCDAHHITIPKPEGITKVIRKTLLNSGVSEEGIDYINAHGTGTPANDKAEAGAIKEVFASRRIPVSSIKSMLGHCMGAASAIEAVSCCLSLREQIAPPTINFTTPDPECDIDCVPNRARRMGLKVVLNNSFAFGGNNCCVVFGHTES